MSRDRLRVVALAVASLVMILVATLVMGWFVLDLGDIGRVEIGLHSARVCQGGECESFSLPSGGSAYATSALIAFWGALVQSLLIAYQTYARISAGVAATVTSRSGTMLGLALVLVGLAVAYVLSPGVGQAEMFAVELRVVRTWAPLLYVVGQLLGVAALRAAAGSIEDVVVGVTPDIERPATAKLPVLTVDEPSVAETSEATIVKKLNYVVLSGEVTTGGIDARRRDKQLLVLWRDVVGFVVRRTPDELGGMPFADLVSEKGSTLRIVPTTRLTGISVAGLGDDRIRSLATYVQSVCPEVAIDGATKKFLGGEPAAQLPTAAMLAIHDERLS